MIPTVNFLLKKPMGSAETLISFCIRFNKRKIQISTKRKIHPSFWNFNTQRPDLSTNKLFLD